MNSLMEYFLMTKLNFFGFQTWMRVNIIPMNKWISSGGLWDKLNKQTSKKTDGKIHMHNTSSNMYWNIEIFHREYNMSYYEWAKQMNFILAVTYGSPRRYWNSSKTFMKKSEKIEINVYDHFRTSWIV